MTMNEETEVNGPVETKADAFKRIGNFRLRKVLDAMDGLKTLAEGNRYEYTADQVARLESVLYDKVAEVIAKFNGTEEDIL